MNLKTGIGVLICSAFGFVAALICSAICDSSLAEMCIMNLVWILIIDKIGEDNK